MGGQPDGGAKGRALRWSLWGVGLAGVAAVVYIMVEAARQPARPDGAASAPSASAAGGGLKALATGEMAKLTVPETPRPGPEHAFLDAQGEPVTVADFKGKVVVLNFWATWCAPCVAEMPTLAKAAQAYAGKPVAVVAVSVDSESATDKAKAFIARNAPLDFYQDPKARMPFALVPPAPGMPTTVIYGADGRERARLSGGADWAGPDARAVIDAVLAES